MGVVYHAIDPNIGRPVAIKTIQLGAVRNSEEQTRLRERLFREARSAGILSHPGIVTIYDVEQQGDLAYIAMEYVDGPTLDHLLSQGAPLDPGRMFTILGQTASALDYAHSKGIVHRDIKPANIMIAADGSAKITDFGIAKITASEQFTMTGSIVGTPHYMSPEQVQGQPVDGRSDQFSLAVIAYEILTGEKPYTGEHLTTVVYKIVAEEPAAPHRINPSLSGPIETVLRKGLAKKPDGRYRTCQEFADALEKACAATKNWAALPRGGSLNAPTLADAGRPAVTLPPGRRVRRSGDTTVTGAQKPKSNFLPFLLAVLMAGGLLALIGWQAAPWLLQRSEQSGTQAQQEPKTAPASTPTQPPASPPTGNPSAASPPAASPSQAANPADAKPSPLSGPPVAPPSEAAAKPPQAPPEQKSTETEEASRPAHHESAPPVRQAAAPQRADETVAVSVVSSPGGATATLDGRPDQACKTPCSLNALPGRHTVAITMPGYQVEHQDVVVGSNPVELQPVMLHALSGTLALTSSPTGATVTINGRRLAQTTPAMIPLAPGSYRITVEKDGRQGTEMVDIRNGEIRTLKILLEQ